MLHRNKSILVQKLKLMAQSKSYAYSSAQKTDNQSIEPKQDGCKTGRAISMPPGMAPTEAQLQAQVAQLLSVALPVDARFHHSPGEGKRGWRSQCALKASGFSAGWPDIEIVWRGRVYFLELKSQKGRVSPAQAECHAGLIAAGARLAVVRSLDEAVATLTQWDIPLRASI